LSSGTQVSVILLAAVNWQEDPRHADSNPVCDTCLSACALTGASALQAADCEDTVARHMVGEALLAAHFVALAEKAGMTPDAINTILKSR